MFKSIFTPAAAPVTTSTATIVEKCQDAVIKASDATGEATRNTATFTHHVAAAFFGGFTRKSNAAQTVIKHYREETKRS